MSKMLITLIAATFTVAVSADYDPSRQQDIGQMYQEQARQAEMRQQQRMQQWEHESQMRRQQWDADSRHRELMDELQRYQYR